MTSIDHDDDTGIDPAFAPWRTAHRTASVVLGVMALIHVSVTFILYDQLTPEAVWFFGTGFGLLFLAVMNFAHVGFGPCYMPTAPVVRISNWIFVLFSFLALAAVPEPQAGLIVIALVVQAIAGQRTLKRAATSHRSGATRMTQL